MAAVSTLGGKAVLVFGVSPSALRICPDWPSAAAEGQRRIIRSVFLSMATPSSQYGDSLSLRRKRAMANGKRFGRTPKLNAIQRDQALKRRAAGETLASIARTFAVDVSTISRLEARP